MARMRKPKQKKSFDLSPIKSIIWRRLEAEQISGNKVDLLTVYRKIQPFVNDLKNLNLPANHDLCEILLQKFNEEHEPEIRKQEEEMLIALARRNISASIQNILPKMVGCLNMVKLKMLFPEPVLPLEKRIIEIKTHELNFVVILTCFADGTKLPPMILTDNMELSTVCDNFQHGVLIRRQELLSLEGIPMIDWLRQVWIKRYAEFYDDFTALIVDVPIPEKLKDFFKCSCTEVIPLTKQVSYHIHPQKQGVEELFKQEFELKMSSWVKQNFCSIKSWKPIFFEPSDICKWVGEAWDQIPPQDICAGFEKLGAVTLKDIPLCPDINQTDDTDFEGKFLGFTRDEEHQSLDFIKATRPLYRAAFMQTHVLHNPSVQVCKLYSTIVTEQKPDLKTTKKRVTFLEVSDSVAQDSDFRASSPNHSRQKCNFVQPVNPLTVSEGSDKVRFRCKICSSKHSTLTGLKIHKRKAHKHYSCP